MLDNNCNIGQPGNFIYVYSYPRYSTESDPAKTVYKIGMTSKSVQSRLIGYIKGKNKPGSELTQVPEDILIFRVFNIEEAGYARSDLRSIEKSFHLEFKDKALRGSDGNKVSGTEWFQVTLEEIDAFAETMNLTDSLNRVENLSEEMPSETKRRFAKKRTRKRETFNVDNSISPFSSVHEDVLAREKDLNAAIKELAELDNVPVLLFSIYKENFLKALPSKIEEIPDKYAIETARKTAFSEVMKVCEEQGTYQDASLAEFIQKEDFSDFRIAPDTEDWIKYRSELGYWEFLSSDREVRKHVGYLLDDFSEKIKILIPEKERNVRLNTSILSLGSARKEKSVISMLSSISKELKTEDLDKSTAEYFLCKNGVIDVRTGKLLDFSPDFYFGSPGLNGTYRPGVESDVLDSIFSSLDNESNKYLRRSIGAAFLGIKSDRLTVLQGSGSNGKSVILNLLNAVGGGYVKVIDSALLREDSSYYTAELSGVNLAIIEEVGSVLDMQRIKAIADTETIATKEFYKPLRRFTNKIAMFAITNNLPELTNLDAFSKPMLSLIKFEKEYSYNPRGNQLLADPGIIEAIEKKDEDLFSATINLIVDNARAYLEDRTSLHSERPEKVKKATDAWINSQSPSAEILSMLEGVPEGEEDNYCLPLVQLVHLVRATKVLGSTNVSAQTVRSIIEEDLKKIFPRAYIKDGGSRIPVKAEISNYHISDNKINSTHSKTRGVLFFGCKIKEEFRE